MTEPTFQKLLDEMTEGIRQRVREWRRERGLSAATFAERLAEIGMPDFNPSVIANYESGRRRSLTVEELFGIAAVLRVSPSVLSGFYWGTGPFAVVDALESDESLHPDVSAALVTLYRTARRRAPETKTTTKSTKKSTKRTRKAN